MPTRPDRTVENEIVVALFISCRHVLGVRDALAATRWIKLTADRFKGTWN